jgi:hypothetical protein
MIPSRSRIVSKLFGVSPKAIRDIWNQRTWRNCTSPLSPAIEIESERHNKYLKLVEEMISQVSTAQVKGVGRPRGSKDTKPRQRRTYRKEDSIMVTNASAIPDSPKCNDLRFVQDHNPVRTITCMQQSKPYSSYPKSSSEHQSTAEFSSSSCLSSTIAASCISMPWQYDNLFVTHGFDTEESEAEASLLRTYPFFLQL